MQLLPELPPRIIFLDIDGVLNSLATYVVGGDWPQELTDADKFDQVSIGLVREACRNGGLKIVVSSTWRFINPWDAIGKAFDLPVIGSTSLKIVHNKRGQEIQDWLNANPEVIEYAIIDDMLPSNFLPGQQSRLIRTHDENGFTWQSYCELCGIFGIRRYRDEILDSPATPGSNPHDLLPS